MSLFDGDFNDAQMLGSRQGWALARRSTGDQKIDTLGNLPPDQTPQRFLIECVIARERCDQRRAASLKHVPPP